MYYIKKSEYERLEKDHSDYCGKSINNPSARVIFEGCIPGNNGNGGTTLLFEGKHFLIVDDEEYTERGSREEYKVENPVDVEITVYNLIKAARLAEPVRTAELNSIKGKYGLDLYKRALTRVLNEEDAITEKLWYAACGGDIETLRAYYMNGGKIGRTYKKFGICHSLIAGAYRNGNFDTVRYLLDIGEKPENHETDIDLKAVFVDEVIKAAEDLVKYFKYHNRNTTKKQDEKISDLEEALRLIGRKI